MEINASDFATVGRGLDCIRRSVNEAKVAHDRRRPDFCDQAMDDLETVRNQIRTIRDGLRPRPNTPR